MGASELGAAPAMRGVVHVLSVAPHQAKEVAPAMHLVWSDLYDAVVDRNGNLYFLGALITRRA